MASGHALENPQWVFWFGDIRGFSTVTVRHGEDVAFRLVQLFQRLLDENLSGLALTPRLRKSYGDGIMLVFPSTEAEGATHLAIALQEAIARHNRDLEAPLLLWVGIGLAQGAARWLDEEPIGHSVNLAKRLAETARGGQVLLSEELGCSLAGAFEMHLREAELKGIGGQRFYELRWGAAELTRLELKFPEITLIGPWGKLVGEFELALILTGDKRMRIELSKELAARLEALPKRLERNVLLRPLGRKLRALVAQAPAGLGRDLPLESVKVGLDPKRQALSLSLRQTRPVGGSFRLSLTRARYDPERLERFLAMLRKLQT